MKLTLILFSLSTASSSVRNVPKGTGNRHHSTRSYHRHNKPASPRDTPAHPPDMFDPATITWEEFVKWGNKETTPVPQKEKKMRFASGSRPR